MTEALPYWPHSPDVTDFDGVKHTQRCNILDCLCHEACSLPSPLVTDSFFMESNEVGRPSEGLSIFLNYGENISRRSSRDRVSSFNLELFPNRHEQERVELSLLTLLLAALRRSLLVCKAAGKEFSMEIGWPTNVRHVTHVTFDRYNGFLGLPAEFEVEVPRRVPSASASVFGVSAESMQCSYDRKGNSVPTILLLIQERLYRQGGLWAEGIFRINAEDSHEQQVRQQLNKGIVPEGVDLHCLAGLIKAWFRELPKGVLDALAPEQVMQCSSEDQCLELVRQLPSTEAALLDWAVNLMADVAQEEEANKMNAHNVAMVFAPNMTQMVDPLTALMHAVQVMNLLKTLILKTMRERQEAALDPRPPYTCAEPAFDDDFDTDNSSAFLHSYREQDSMENDELVREALIPPFNSPNRKSISDEDHFADKSGELFFFDLDERIGQGEPTYQGEGLLFESVSPNKKIKARVVESKDVGHSALVYPEDGRGQVRKKFIGVAKQAGAQPRQRCLNKYGRSGFDCESGSIELC